jgi:hypothetical protein
MDPVLQDRGIFPHDTQYDEAQKQKQNADTLAAQQAADAAAAGKGPEPMAVRDQLIRPTASADEVTSSGNEADTAGIPLGSARKVRAARRVLVG